MHNYLNMRKEQMIINTCKMLPFLKNSRTHDSKMTPFSWFREFAPPIEKIPLFRENGYERGIRLSREWRGREVLKQLLADVLGPSLLHVVWFNFNPSKHK